MYTNINQKLLDYSLLFERAIINDSVGYTLIWKTKHTSGSLWSNINRW